MIKILFLQVRLITSYFIFVLILSIISYGLVFSFWIRRSQWHATMDTALTFLGLKLVHYMILKTNDFIWTLENLFVKFIWYAKLIISDLQSFSEESIVIYFSLICFYTFMRQIFIKSFSWMKIESWLEPLIPASAM
jgi:hypothetical protein